MILHDGNAYIACGDCVELLRTTAAHTVDCIWTDPPYNIGVAYDCYHDRRPQEEFKAWCQSWLAECARVLRPGGACWVLVSDRMADWFGMFMFDFFPFRRARVIWQESFAQYQSRTFTCETRHLFYHVKDGARYQWHPDRIRVPSARQLRYKDKRANPLGRVPGNVWQVSRVCGTFKARTKGHPAQVPIELVQRCLLATTEPGDTILDPFAGSGTTLIAARKLDRRAIGYEISPSYCDLIQERLLAEV